MSVLAITGGTGFVGSHLIDVALMQGHRVRALTRRPLPPREHVAWIDGSLDRTATLATLVDGADAVIHVAGLVNAADRAGFAASNVDGTRAMIEAASRRRFIHVSSLSAREPSLSDYGWSKAEAEHLIERSDLDWTIVRPPGIFGPRDTETLPLFRAAARHLVPVPPAGGRASWIYAPDLASLLVKLAIGDGGRGMVLEPDDGTPGGWDHRDFARAIATALGVKALPLSLPPAILSFASAVGRRVGGSLAKLTADRVGYMVHPDWTSHAPPPAALWRPGTATPVALAATARWYREHGLL